MTVESPFRRGGRPVSRFTAVVAVAVLCAASPALSGDSNTGATAAAPAPEVAVYAAASLRDVLGAIKPACEGRTGSTLIFNFGASNDLARQIVAANKAEVFISADESWMDQVAEAGLVDADSRRTILSNRLVVVVPADSTLRINSASDVADKAVSRLSLANPEAVPAGKYARAWLEKAGVWDEVGERVVPAVDVRGALAAVEAGAADAGIVYRTDAAITKKVRIAYIVPETEGPRIVYVIAALKDRPQHDLARQVIACFEGTQARAQFERSGFVVLPPGEAAAPGK